MWISKKKFNKIHDNYQNLNKQSYDEGKKDGKLLVSCDVKRLERQLVEQDRKATKDLCDMASEAQKDFKDRYDAGYRKGLHAMMKASHSAVSKAADNLRGKL